MYIYVFGKDDVVKVGVSINPTRRIKAIPFLNILFQLKTNKAHLLEYNALSKFKEYSIGGEYLKIDPFLVIDFIKKNSLHVDELTETFQELDLDGIPIGVTKNGYINFTNFYKLLINHTEYGKGHLYTKTLNIFNNISIKQFEASFLNKYGYDAKISVVGNRGYILVHPFLFVEIIRSLDNPNLKIAVYDLLLSGQLTKMLRND